MTPKAVKSKLPALLDELDGLLSKYVGKKAESEEWSQTCERFERLAKLTKAVRREQTKP